jgi:hypothetical protein
LYNTGSQFKLQKSIFCLLASAFQIMVAPLHFLTGGATMWNSVLGGMRNDYPARSEQIDSSAGR